MPDEQRFRREVVLHDKSGRGHAARVMLHTDGDVYVEVDGKHGGTTVYSTLNLGPMWALLEKLAPLR